MRGAETNQHHQKLVALCQHGSVQLRLLLSAMYYRNFRIGTHKSGSRNGGARSQLKMLNRLDVLTGYIVVCQTPTAMSSSVRAVACDMR
jgi:hypothetical protein